MIIALVVMMPFFVLPSNWPIGQNNFENIISVIMLDNHHLELLLIRYSHDQGFWYKYAHDKVENRYLAYKYSGYGTYKDWNKGKLSQADGIASYDIPVSVETFNVLKSMAQLKNEEKQALKKHNKN